MQFSLKAIDMFTDSINHCNTSTTRIIAFYCALENGNWEGGERKQPTRTNHNWNKLLLSSRSQVMVVEKEKRSRIEIEVKVKQERFFVQSGFAC